MAKTFNYRALIRSAARRIWLWSPMRKEAIRNARVSRGYVACQLCERWMKEHSKPKPYEVDHTIPASEPSVAIHNWNDFFERLFVPAAGLSVLCKECHKEKTSRENQKRAITRARRKVRKNCKRKV